MRAVRANVLAAVLVHGMVLSTSALAGEVDLEKGFLDPPGAYRPWVYWWWLDGFATREGITRDLEEMERQGISGVLLFDAGEGGPDAPKGPSFMSHEWRELFRHAVREAARLGLEVGVNLASGWDSGGVWVTPEHAAKRLVWSEAEVRGPGPVEMSLPAPEAQEGYYREIAVLAVPGTRSPAPVRIGASSSRPDSPPALAGDGSPETCWASSDSSAGPGPSPGRPEWLLVEFAEPFAAGALHIVLPPGSGPRDCAIESSPDGKTFQGLARFTLERDDPRTVEFPESQARFFRLVIESGASSPPGPVKLREVQLLRRGQRPSPFPLKRWDLQAARGFLTAPPDVLLEESPEVPGERDCEGREVRDLTARMDPSGRLSWDAPEGGWTVLRFGYTLLGAKTKCVSPGTQGYEIDFFSAEAMDLQFAETAEKLIADAGPLAGPTLKYVHDDSYEVSGANGLQPTWTPAFMAEFKARRGYEPLPYLPVLARRIVDGREASHRFLRDYRRTIGDLFSANHYRRLRDLAHRRGLGTHPESGGPFWPHIDALECEGLNDIPMGEFWKRTRELKGKAAWEDAYPICDTVRQAAAAAHIYGKPLCQAEAFTSMGPNWEEDFFDLKDVGDRAFCAGLTRHVLCFYVHQGLRDIRPGYQWEAAGTHFDRNVTWWDQMHAFTRYLARCQLLLRQGLFAADLLYFYGEDVPAYVPSKDHMRPPLPRGRDCDTANADVLVNRLEVKDGRLALPDGMSYRALVLPERRTMSPAVLRKVRDLIEAGATVIGPRPERAPGLTGFPRADEEVRRLAVEVWGEASGAGVKERKFGGGRIVWGRTTAEVLAGDGVPPDFEVRGGERLDFIHRDLGDGGIYFVSNQEDRTVKAECAFRIAGKRPEIWDPVTGGRRDAGEFREEGGRTIVPVELAPRESLFFVFRKPPGGPGPAGRRNFPVLRRAAELSGPWRVNFDPARGGPGPAVFEELEDWTRRPEPGIRFYSGKATYEKEFDLPEALRRPGSRLFLSLGQVKALAEVRLDGRDLGVVWTAPWRVEITGTLRPEGNRLEIDVVNLWPNRLIGDAALPPERRTTVTNVKKFKADSPLLPSGLLGPVTLEVEE